MPLLILHGMSGNEPEHWQTWLAQQASASGFTVHYPMLPAPEQPLVSAWIDVVLPLLDKHEDGLEVVAHSLGCHLWAHLATATGRQLADRALLVAPPGPQELREHVPTFEPASFGPELRLTCPDTALVLGEGDPWLAAPESLLPSGLPMWRVQGGRHLDVESGYGPWPAMMRWIYGGDPPGIRWEAA